MREFNKLKQHAANILFWDKADAMWRGSMTYSFRAPSDLFTRIRHAVEKREALSSATPTYRVSLLTVLVWVLVVLWGLAF